MRMKTFIRLVVSIWILIFLMTVMRFFATDSYRYSNSDGSFTFEVIPSKGRNIAMMYASFASFKTNNNIEQSTTIYRTFSRQYWKFWLWINYVNNEYYRFPYKDWEEIKKKRGIVENKSPYQDF